MKKYSLLLSILILLSSCEKIFFKKKGDTINAVENFEYLWKEVDSRYSFFDYKNIDWNTVHTKYAPLVYDGMTEDSLFNVMGAMLTELRDGHTNLISPFNISRFYFQFQGMENIDERVVSEFYLGTDAVSTGPFRHNFLHNKEVGYIRFPSFTGTVDELNLDYVIRRYKDTKGIIFDIRQNGGGAGIDIYNILARFIDEKTTLYRVRNKTGPGHNEFGEPDDHIISPSPNRKYLKKVILLTDRGTFSAGSYLTLGAKNISNILIMGDTTGGGLGLPNGGQLPNGWIYRCSVTQTLDLYGNNYENGIPPDKRVLVDKGNLANGVDDVIETAVNEIL